MAQLLGTLVANADDLMPFPGYPRHACGPQYTCKYITAHSFINTMSKIHIPTVFCRLAVLFDKALLKEGKHLPKQKVPRG